MRRHLAIVIATLCVAFGAAAQTPPHETTTLIVFGKVAAPRTLTIDDLKRCPAHLVEYRPPPGFAPADRAASPRQYNGCLLRDILAAAKPLESKPRELRKTYIVATASDGYALILSWAEVFTTSADESVIVAFEREGKPLSADEGRIALIAVSGMRPARQVERLRSLEVRTIDP